MEVIPVLDLQGGQVVHARGGRRDEYRPIATPLSRSSAPAAVLAGLLRLHPFRRLYVADLDAIAGTGSHLAALAALRRAHPGLEIWLDAGLADAAAAEAVLAEGCCPVLGSESQADTALVRALRDEPRAVLSLDFRGAAFQGPPALRAEAALWPLRVVAMTLAAVGGQAGPDLTRVQELAGRAADRSGGGCRVYAAGGVRDAADLRALAAAGAAGALVATALHAGTLGAAELEGLSADDADLRR
jgi:phosphoribosylformimino-5-aminoimidazole carboxamide ribotide isomerase